MGVFPSVFHQFRKGNPGGPGRPKGPPRAKRPPGRPRKERPPWHGQKPWLMLRAWEAGVLDLPEPVVDALVELWVVMAISGEYRALKTLLDAVEGPVPRGPRSARVAVDDGPDPDLDDPDLPAILAALGYVKRTG